MGVFLRSLGVGLDDLTYVDCPGKFIGYICDYRCSGAVQYVRINLCPAQM
jgi:hypothetical protein